MAGDNQSSPALTTAALPILAVAFAVGLLFDYFLYGKIFGLGYSLFVVAIVAGIAAVSRISGKRLTRGARWCAVLAIVFAAGASWRASYELVCMNILLSMFLLLLAVSEQLGNPIRKFVIEKYPSLAWLPMYFLGNAVTLFGALFAQRNGERQGKGKAVARGILLALPFVVLFTLLFSSADLVFQKYVKEVVNIKISTETLVRSFLVVFVILGFSGAAWFMFVKARTGEPQPADAKRSNLGGTEVGILLGSVNTLFLLFIVVQLTYLFGGRNSIASQGFTYAEYARRGFFELIVVAVITWLVVWTLNRALANGDPKVKSLSKFLSAALVVQVFIIMASAFMRLALYEQAYGFTTLRFYSHIFTVWLAVVFVLLLYKLFVSRREDLLAFTILVSVLTFGVAVNVFNPDAFIARQNIERYTTSGKVDVFYLDQLSPDAVQAVLPLVDNDNIELSRIAANRFYWKLDRLDRSASTWQSFNLGRWQARTALLPKRQELEKSKDFIPSIDFLKTQSTVSD